MIEAYIYASCTSCRKTVAQLEEAGAQFERRDFFRHPFSRDELRSVLDRAGLAPRDVLSRRSKVYLARSEEIDALDDDALLDLMLEEPTLLRRPLVVKDDRVVVGHHAGKLAELIAS